MGYVGLGHWVHSDGASDFFDEVKSYKKNLEAVLELFKKESTTLTNEYNTDGCVNVALVMQEPYIEKVFAKDFHRFHDIFLTCISLLKSKIESCEESVGFPAIVMGLYEKDRREEFEDYDDEEDHDDDYRNPEMKEIVKDVINVADHWESYHRMVRVLEEKLELSKKTV